MAAYETISDALNGLRQRGFTLDFNLLENCLVCQGSNYKAADFEIVEVYRFEGQTDPADEAVVYAIQSAKGEKGVLVTGYGVSAEGMGAEIAAKLAIHHSG